MAILKPEPSSVCSPMVRRRSYAVLAQRAVGREEQVGVRAQPAAADAAADLVQLAEAEHVGAVDHERVDRAACRCRSR